MDQLKTGEFISFLRKEKKMTQSELGELLGVSGKAVCKWERGKSFPDITLQKPLSECLGTTVNELLEGSVVKDDRQQNADEKLIQTLLYNYHLRRGKNIWVYCCHHCISAVFYRKSLSVSLPVFVYSYHRA